MDIFDYIEVGLVLFCAACLLATSLVEPMLWVVQTKAETWLKNHLNAREDAEATREVAVMDAHGDMHDPVLSVVEAYPGYVKHLRKLDPEESPAYGGLSSKPTTLCGMTIAMGWDTKIPSQAFLELSDKDWGTHDRCGSCFQRAIEEFGEEQEENS